MRKLPIALALALALGLAGCVGETDPATNVTATSAQLNAHGRTDDGPATWWWEYGLSADAVDRGQGFRTPRRGPAESATDVQLSEVVTALNPGTTYHFRACGQDVNDSARKCGRRLSFTTLHRGEQTGPATYLTDRSATLNGELASDRSGDTEYWFEFGPTTSYGTRIPAASGRLSLGAGADRRVSATTQGTLGQSFLTPSTSYHFRLCARPAAGGATSCGADSGFTTKPAGGRGGIAWDTLRAGGGSEIYVMRPDGSGKTRITDFIGQDTDPAWSPDGRRIAFSTDRDDLNGDNYELYVVNADGTNPTRLTNTPAAEVYPAWSPDGTKIAFATDRDGPDEVYVMNADGSNQVNITRNGGIESDPAWSPDGRRIAFTYQSRTGEPEIHAVNADGSHRVNLTNHADYDSSPTWSPDGLRIAFESYRNGSGDVFTMDRQGGGQAPIAGQTGQREHYPSFSPWGDLAFTRDQGDGLGTGDIISPSTGGNLTGDAAGNRHPAWSPRPYASGE